VVACSTGGTPVTAMNRITPSSGSSRRRSK